MSTCQACQRVCATSRVTLMQNIGFVIARQSKNLTADLCRDCGLRMAKEMTLITAFFGWWGVISFVLTPIILMTNLVAWSKLSKLPAPDAPWEPPMGLGTPDAVAAPGFIPATPAPAAQQARAEKTAKQSLWVSIFSVVFFCVPLVSAAGLYMGWKAKRQSDEDGTPFPKAALAGLALSGLSMALFLLFAFGAFMGWRETEAKLQAVRAKADPARVAARLTQDGACALLEERVIEERPDGKKVNSVSCAEPPEGSAERTELTATLELEDGSRTVTACLRKGERWFVAALEPCAKAPLSPVTKGLSTEQQEARWRDAEKQAAESERVDLVRGKLEAIRQAVEGDGELKRCSRDITEGRTIPRKLAALGGDAPYRYVSSLGGAVATVDREVLDGKKDDEWAFLSSRDVLSALDGNAEGARAVQGLRYLVVTDAAVGRDLPTVPSKSPGARYDAGDFLGLMYLADLKTGALLCTAPFAFENSETIHVTTYRGGRAADSTVLSEARRDFANQYVKALEGTLDRVLRQEALTAEVDNDVKPSKPATKKPAPAAMKARKSSP